ncbi:MAG: phospholipase [Solirubrobacteraceae bacterium]
MSHTHHALAPAATCASVALDIGDGRGALVLYPSERFRGREIEISQVGGDGRRVHTGVHERAAQVRSVLTAIFGSLAAGDYQVWEDEHTPGPVVTVSERSVAEVALR